MNRERVRAVFLDDGKTEGARRSQIAGADDKPRLTGRPRATTAAMPTDGGEPMTLIAAHVYRDGVRVGSTTLDDRTPHRTDEFVWIALFEPDPPELAAVGQRFGLHPLAVEDALDAHQLPKVEVYGDGLFVVLRTAALDDAGRIVYGETHAFVGADHIVTIQHGSAPPGIADVERLERAPSLLRNGPDYVLHWLVDRVVDGYQPIVERIEDEVLATEQTALETFLSGEEVRRLFHLQRELVRFGRILGPMEEVAGYLARVKVPVIDAQVTPYFRDVADHVRHVSNRLDTLREIVSSVFEVSSLLEQQRQSAVTRRLAAWAAILAIPTAVASIYGMNFEFMPGLRSRQGFVVVLAGVLAVCLFLYQRFRRYGWL